MAVENVNGSNSNTGLYTSAAALAGGGAGAAAGWYSKPYLKDGAPTDSFIKKMGENIKEIMSPEEKELAEAINNQVESSFKKIDEVKSIEDMKNLFINNTIGDASLKDLKFQVRLGDEVLNSMGISNGGAHKIAEKISKANSLDEVKEILAKSFDEEFKGKSLDDIKTAFKSELKTAEQTSAKKVFEQFWDSSKKQFVDCEEGMGKAIKKAAKSIQGKAALIYGAVGAAVLGAVTYLCCGNKKS